MLQRHRALYIDRPRPTGPKAGRRIFQSLWRATSFRHQSRVSSSRPFLFGRSAKWRQTTLPFCRRPQNGFQARTVGRRGSVQLAPSHSPLQRPTRCALLADAARPGSCADAANRGLIRPSGHSQRR